MVSTITGIGSGFDIDGWVSSLVAVKKTSTVIPLQSKLSKLQTTNNSVSGLKSKYSALKSALQTFTRNSYGSTNDIWANTKIESSESDYVTATSSGAVSAASIDVVVKNIATATVAQSAGSLGSSDVAQSKFVDLANGQAKEGTFSLFLDDKRYEINIDKEDTLQNVIDKINSVTKADEESPSLITATLQDGILSIKPVSEDSSLVLGSTGDTSNFVSALKLYEEDGNGYKNKAEYAISKVNTSVAMADEKSGLGAITFGEEGKGTIKINGAEFTVDEKTTLNDLVAKINGNSEAHVKASYDSLTNKLILTATETGKSNIALEEENTNLLRVLKLTQGTDGNEVLAEGSQKLGENARVLINNNEVISNSNTITGESSGISNLSITVKKATTGEDNVPASAKLTIDPDYTKVKEALKTFVSNYKDVVASTKSAISTDGNMAHDSSLSSILNTIKSVTTTSSENEGVYSVLSQIGITTSSSDPSKLEINEEKLNEVLEKDFDSVKLLLSDGYTNDKDTGLFDKLLKNVDNVLDTQNGYFSSKTESLNSQIKLLNTRIDRANDLLNKYEIRVTDQFNKMDSIMSQLSAQLSTFQAYIR